MPEPLCGACRSRPRKLKSHVDGLPVYYDWCAVCRELAGLDRLEKRVRDFEKRRGERVDESPVKE